MDIHAPFTRAERMDQLAEIDRVSNNAQISAPPLPPPHDRGARRDCT